MHPQIAALVLHHVHTSTASHLLSVAQGSQGQGQRFLVLAIAAIILGTILGTIHHTFSRG